MYNMHKAIALLSSFGAAILADPLGPEGSVRHVIAFGDSYTQTGFDHTNVMPNASNPLGNPAFPGDTTSGGPNWLGFYIARENTTTIYAYNFARSGANTNCRIAPFKPGAPDFVDQVGFFKSIASRPASVPWDLNDALFAIWMGINDVGNAYLQSNFSAVLNATIASYFDQVRTLYNAGGRKFLFLTVPPINRTPIPIAEGTVKQLAIIPAIAAYNEALTNRIAEFRGAFQGVQAWLLRTTVAFDRALDNPAAFGAPDNMCFHASGTKCLWWDSYHPGQAIHKLIAQDVAALLRGW